MEKKTTHLEELRTQALDFILTSWQVEEVKQKYPVTNYDELVERTVRELTQGIKPNPIMIRLAGQSGSGKSTQLLPSAIAGFDSMGISPILIMVRFFANFHPFYNEIKSEYGEAMLRENTNGFALMLLFLTIERLIEQRYPIIFEVTLLDERFETYLYELAKQNNYKIDFHVIAVSKLQSDKWIHEREISSTTEQKRKVAKASSDYFYKTLPLALKAIANIGSDDCFIWDSISKEPVFSGTINNLQALATLEEYRKQDFTPRNVEELKKEKKAWFENHYRKEI